jgi:PBP1b-binding outer membrane lipoprotein LpoB
MNRSDLLFVAVCALLLAGCASTDKKQSAADDDEKTYVTGSRIPVKDRSAVNATTDRKAIDDMFRKGATGGGGGGS